MGQNKTTHSDTFHSNNLWSDDKKIDFYLCSSSPQYFVLWVFGVLVGTKKEENERMNQH